MTGRFVSVAILVLAFRAGAESLDFGVERPIDPQPVDLAPDRRQVARVGVNEDGSLVIWTDYRTGSAELYAARLERDGTLLDPTGRLVAEGGYAGDVIWTGSAWLIAYGLEGWVYVRTMSTEGILGPPLRAVKIDWIDPRTIRMKTNGSTVLLVTNAGKGALLSLDGELRREITMARSETDHESTADIVVRNGVYSLAYLTPQGVAFRQVRTIDDGPTMLLPESSGAGSVTIGTDGAEFLVVYSIANLHAQRINAGVAPYGQRRTLTNYAQPPGTGPAAQFPSIAWRGSDYFLTFTREATSEAMAMHLSGSGEPLGPPVAFAPFTRLSEPHVDVREDGSGVAVWVFGRVVQAGFFEASSNAPGNVREISRSAPSQRNVRVAGSGNFFVTAWMESTSRGSELRVARNVGQRSITVPTGTDPTLVDVAIDGDVVWVVYTSWSPYGVWARRYTTALTPMDDEPVKMAWDGGQVAAGGGSLAVTATWGIRYPGIMVSVATPVGDTFVVETIAMPTNTTASDETIAWNGNEFVVAWAQGTETQWWQFPEIFPQVIHAMRIGPNGVLRDPVPLIVSDEPNVLITKLETAPAAGGVAMVWQREILLPKDYGWTPTPEGAKTFAARFDGSERPVTHVIAEPPPRSLRALTAVGEKFLLIWGSSTVAPQYALLSPEFQTEATGPVSMPTDDFDVAATAGLTVLAYSRIAREAESGGVHRVFVRTSAEMPRRRRAVR